MTISQAVWKMRRRREGSYGAPGSVTKDTLVPAIQNFKTAVRATSALHLGTEGHMVEVEGIHIAIYLDKISPQYALPFDPIS
jgi:hypothetical protein